MRSRIIAALSLSLVACSVVATFDGLVGSGESSDGGEVDGAKTTSDGSVLPVVDGSMQNITDGASFDGSLLDSGSKPDVVVLGFCASHQGHTYCDDFDTTNTLVGRWSTTTNIGTAGVSTGDFVSPPREAIAVSPDNDAAVDGENDIEKSFFATKSLDVEAALKTTLTASSDILAIEFIPTDQSLYSYCYFDVAGLNGGGTILESECVQPDGGNAYQSLPLTAAQPNWDRVHIGVSMVASQVTATMSGTTKSLPFPAGLSTTKFNVIAGVAYKQIGGPAVVRVDDVLVDTK